MKKKYCVALLGVFIGTGLLAGCAKTPESSIVKQKGQKAMENYKEAEPSDDTGDAAEDTSADAGAGAKGASDDANSTAEGTQTVAGTEQAGELRARLGAPEHYQNETTDATGRLKIVTDADVEIPAADKASMIAVSQHPLDQEQIDRITETFFGDADVYDGYSLMQRTKGEIQEQLEEVKGYAAQGNLDPYGWGTDENGNYIYDINQSIEELEAAVAEAPEERVWKKVKPQFGLYEENDSYFNGYVSMPDGTYYEYTIDSWGTFPFNVKIEKIGDIEDTSHVESWLEYDSLNTGNIPGLSSEEELKEEVGISLEEAMEIAGEKVEKLGFTDMEINAWELGVKYWENPDITSSENVGYDSERQTGVGYILHYTRTLDGVPVTYTQDYGGALESMESEMETWGYERLDITVSGDGIERVEFLNRYDIGEVRTENLELLPFDEVMQIYEKMMQISNADVLNYEKERTYYINRIAFGYSRIYEPASDARSGILVPVWNFFGSVDASYEEADGTVVNQKASTAKYASHLTINAVDGSVIDLGLGY